MKLFLKIVLCIILVFVVAVGSLGLYITRGLKEGQDLAINPISAAQLADGKYEGSYGKGRWQNEVSVTIKDNRITQIDILKSVLFEKPEVSKGLFDKVIEKQNTTVDVMTGATVTSKAYLKAVEDALTD